MKPDKAQGIGGFVDVFELFKSGEAVVLVVERYFDCIVDFLLPIIVGVRCQVSGVGLVHQSFSGGGCGLTESR